MKDRKKRTLVIGILCCLLVFMGVGFAVMNATLNINGTATAINTWDVRMTNIEVVNKSDGATNKEDTKINEDGVTAIFKSDFTKPGDYITYEVTIENRGSIDAILEDISITLNVAEQDKDLFNIIDTRPSSELLEAGRSAKFTIKVEFRSDADRMPSGDIEYIVKVDYSQQDEVIIEDEGDWTVRVNSDGLITAYNYSKGPHAVIPAEVDGIPVKTINQNSFEYKNIEFYQNNSTGRVHAVIYETEPNYSVVKEKAITLFAAQTCGGTAACIEQVRLAAVWYKPGEYNFSNGSLKAYINPDPNVDVYSSMIDDLKSRITTLDLSNAIHLTTIENKAFYRSATGTETRLENVVFPKSGNLAIGDEAFRHNNFTTITITPAVKTIGVLAFSHDVGFKGKRIQRVIFDENSNLTTIGNLAFASNEISGELNLPESLVYLSGFGNNQITKVIIPDGVEIIGFESFFANELERVTIPSSVIKIEGSAFIKQENSEGTNTLQSIIIKRTESDFLANVTVGTGWYDNSLKPTISYIPN